MAILELRSVTKVYGNDTPAVSDLDLDIEDGEFVILVGPSGCGKSTILRMMAGLEEITRGEFLMDGKVMNSIEPQKRELAMVFQSYALYPHLSVYENLAFPLKLRKMGRGEMDTRVREAGRILGLTELLARMPRELSGGQRQRVALGRAMVRQPKAFLFDEPLSNLDAKLRGEMRVEIAELHRRLGSNFVYVTHDQTEAMTLGQRIVVLRDGRLQQCAAPEELFDRPANLFVAAFIGTPPMNFVTVEVQRQEEAYRLVDENLRVTLPASYGQALETYGRNQVILGIRPKDLSIRRRVESMGLGRGAKGEGSIRGLFLLKEVLGDEVLYHVDTASKLNPKQMVVVKEAVSMELERGSPAELSVDSGKIYLFDPESKRSIL